MNRSDAESFVVEFNRAYDEKTALGTLCDRREYDGNGEFFQIGRRVSVPTSLIEEGRFRYVSDGVVGALCEGEKSFVARRLGSLAESGNVPTHNTRGSLLEAAREGVNEPTALLVPRDERGDTAVAEWEDDGKLSRFGRGEYVTDGDTDLWLHRHDGDGLYALNAGLVGVAQKKGEEARPPNFDAPKRYGELNDGEYLTVDFGDDERDGFTEIVYRVVVSEPTVEEDGACLLL